MENRNIYKLDDVLLVLSVILLIPAAFFAWPWLKGLPDVKDMAAYIQAAPSFLGSQMIYVLSYIAGALLTQIAGRYLRYQETLSLKILDEVGYSRKVRISELSSRLGMSDGKVEKLVRKLSRVKSLNIGIEGDRIVRSRSAVRSSEIRGNEERSGEVRNTGDLRSEIKEKQVDLLSMMKQMKETGEKPDLEELRRKGYTVETKTEYPTETRENVKMPFSFPVMGLLIFLFLTPLWPISLIIFIRKAMKQRGMSRNDET